MTTFADVIKEWSKPLISLGIFVMFMIVGTVFYNTYEGWSVETCFGFIIVTISTVGYGYTVPTDDKSRLFTIFFMFFGVYFIFATVAEGLTFQLERMKKLVKRDFSETNMNVNEVHRSHQLTFIVLVVAILACIFIGAVVLMHLEGWSFITAVYFCVETMTTVGYGDMAPLKGEHTHTFMAFYIIVSVVLLGFVVNNIQQLKAERKQLGKIQTVLQKKQNLDFLMDINNGNGITQSQFVLALLEHLGTLDAEKDINPWIEKFKELDEKNTGVLDINLLGAFVKRESDTAQTALAGFVEPRTSIISINEMWHRSTSAASARQSETAMSPIRPSNTTQYSSNVHDKL